MYVMWFLEKIMKFNKFKFHTVEEHTIHINYIMRHFMYRREWNTAGMHYSVWKWKNVLSG